MANRKVKSPDARLIALGVELETAIKAWRKAWEPFAAAEDTAIAERKRANNALPKNKTLLATSADLLHIIGPHSHHLLHCVPCGDNRAQYYVTHNTLQTLREKLLQAKRRRRARNIGGWSDGEVKRCEEIIRALEKHYAKAEKLEAAKEIADDRQALASKAAFAIGRRILKMPARTLEGVMVKFRAASWVQWGEENPRAFESIGKKPAEVHGEDTAALFGVGCDVAAIIKRSAG